MSRLADLPGVLVKDVPRYLRALSRSGVGHRSDPDGWISLRNRNERLIPGEVGYLCDWESGTSLHAPEILPWLGARIMAAALAEWPVEFRREPRHMAETPAVSFIFTHAGKDRLPQLRRVIESVNAQLEVPCEIIVVCQDASLGRLDLPPHVRQVHLDTASLAPGWYKSWGYNVGAGQAKSELLVFHDGDICVPAAYARELRRQFARDEDSAASLQRFLFYLDRDSSEKCVNSYELPEGIAPVAVRQNWKGGTIAIRRMAFHRIGGFDEGFVDWGGEDDEFYDRCVAVGHQRSGYLPFVHLWHPPQEQRKSERNPNTSIVMPWRMSLSREARIAELNSRRYGETTSPDPPNSYKKAMAR